MVKFWSIEPRVLSPAIQPAAVENQMELKRHGACVTQKVWRVKPKRMAYGTKAEMGIWKNTAKPV